MNPRCANRLRLLGRNVIFIITKVESLVALVVLYYQQQQQQTSPHALHRPCNVIIKNDFYIFIAWAILDFGSIWSNV